MLAQPSGDFVRVGSLSLWRSANFDIARVTFSVSALCACRIALAGCNAVRILTSLAQPSRHFAYVGSLSLGCGAVFG